MKIVANDYKANEVIKIIREWSGKTQEEFGKNIGRTKNAIQFYEYGQRNYDFELLLKIAKKEGLIITIEKMPFMTYTNVIYNDIIVMEVVMFKEYRMKLKITQEELAERSDLNTRTVQRIENDEEIPKIETFAKLINVLGISDKDILKLVKDFQK